MWCTLPCYTLSRSWSCLFSMRILSASIVMSYIIHFRSKQNQKHTWIGSEKKMRSRWSEYDTIHPATPYDDARDIAWKQSAKSDSLYTKSREDTMNISIRLIGIYDESWDFSLDYRDEKTKFYQTLDHACRDTSKYYKYIYDEKKYTHMSIEWVSKILRNKHLERELIIIMTSDLESIHYEGLSPLAKHNDIILLHILHPYESNPDIYTGILCESRSIDSISYKQSLTQVQKDIKEYLSNNNIAYIWGISTDNPTILLNYFFKNRYAR